MDENNSTAGGVIPPANATAPVQQSPATAVPPIAAAPKTTAPATAASIAARLEGGEEPNSQPSKPVSTVPVAEEPTASAPAPAFDLSMLTPEQLISLKAMLDGAPLRVVKKGNPIVKLRRMNINGQFKIVLDFGTCVNTLQKDDLTQVTSEVVLIPVKFLKEDGTISPKFEHVQYRDFMNAEQIKCEVVSSRQEPGRIVEGEVESNERPGVMVELEVKTVNDFFTVKLPEGSPLPQVEIAARLANA